ncbi:MAG: hypothetical protein ACI9U0_001277, partial [Flavobacteriales bacterium]
NKVNIKYYSEENFEKEKAGELFSR